VARGAPEPRRPRDRASTGRPSSPAASSSASPSPGRSCPPERRVRRRADRQPRLAHGREILDSSARRVETTPDPRHGHPRRPRRDDRRSDPLPRRRPIAKRRALHRRRDHRRGRGVEPVMTSVALRGSRPQAPAPSSPRSRSSSASRWSAAHTSSPTRSSPRSTRSSPARTEHCRGDHRQVDRLVRAERLATVPRRCCQVQAAAESRPRRPDLQPERQLRLRKLIGRDGKPLGSSGNPTSPSPRPEPASSTRCTLTAGRWASGPHES
jgi:hypothetical protein